MDLKKFYDDVIAKNAKIEEVATRINTLFDGGKIEEAQKLQPDLAKAKAEYAAANSLYLEMAGTQRSDNPAQNFVPTGAGPANEPKQNVELRASDAYRAQWFAALKNGVKPKNVAQFGAERYGLLVNALTETGGSPAGEEGGFLNPVSFDNVIHDLMREFIDLSDYFTIDPVTTLSGWRAFEQFAAALPLTKHTEGVAVTAEGESPLFNRVDFTLDEYFDFLPVSNSLLADTPVNIMAYLGRWFAKKLVLTHNALLLTLINALTGTAVTDNTTTLGAIKTAFNKTLDPAFSASASLFTNQSGLEVLDSLVDGVGRPLLQPDPSAPTKFLVKGRPVVVLSDAHWPNMTNAARTRIAIGDGKEYAHLFERAGFEFASTLEGGDAWRSNGTEIRGIARLDCAEADTGAMTVLKVTL